MIRILACSLSRSVWERLPAQPAPGRVLAVFERSCLLSSSVGDPLSLVLPEVGDGPLNVVVQAAPACLSRLAPGVPARLSNGCLQAGDVEVDLTAARVWEPCPPWDHLRARLPGIEGRLDTLRAAAVGAATRGSLLSLLPGDSARGEGLEGSVRQAARRAADLVRAGWAGGEQQARAAAAQLAGLGPGLTPAGDDFLAGVMLWAWLAHPTPRPFCRVLLGAAAQRTTALSAAFLRAAARGECSAAWHLLLERLATPEDAPGFAEAVARVLSYGHTSGADTLTGFLWMAAFPDQAGPA